MSDEQRLIEDYIPIEAISNEARREKSVRKGHISTLHLWWARRPLVACRAAVYGALVPAPKGKKAAREAREFVAELCKYPGSKERIRQAQGHILEAHAARLTEERGELVTVADIEAGRAPRPRVLDMFAGGGAIPLEALRLGCEAYALDLNPVAHIIELCTLVYPQQYGAPDGAARGSAADGTWAGLAQEAGQSRTTGPGPGRQTKRGRLRCPGRDVDPGSLPVDAHRALQEPGLRRHSAPGPPDVAGEKEWALYCFAP
jgi:putative DNA methylase